jgi:hypothetical protein
MIWRYIGRRSAWEIVIFVCMSIYTVYPEVGFGKQREPCAEHDQTASRAIEPARAAADRQSAGADRQVSTQGCGAAAGGQRKGYDPDVGAPPLKRVLQKRVESLLAPKILGGEVFPEDLLRLDFADGEYRLERVESGYRQDA